MITLTKEEVNRVISINYKKGIAVGLVIGVIIGSVCMFLLLLNL